MARGGRSADGGRAGVPALRAQLLHGVYATPGSPDATQFLWHGPGLPALLAPPVALGTPLWALRLSGPLLLFAAIVLFERLLAMTLPRRWALAGTWALGLYAPFGELVGPLHKEPLALQHAALAGIAAHPAGYALNIVANIGRMLVAAPFSVGLAPRLGGGYALFTLGLLGALVWALARAWPQRRRLPRTAAPFAAFALGGFLVHLAPSAEPRLVIPLVPLLVWLALHAAAVARAQEIVRPARAGSGHDPFQASTSRAARGGRLDRRLRQRRHVVDGSLDVERGRDVGRDG